MSLGEGYSIEEQLTGKADVGGIQFDLFPQREDYDCRFSTGEDDAALYARKTPQELSIAPGTTLKMSTSRVSRLVILWPETIRNLFDF